MKRMLICLLGGLGCAAICTIGKLILTPSIAASTLLSAAIGNRILIGFVIGLGGLRMQYLLRGALLGLVVTLSYSIGMLPDGLVGFAIYTVLGVVYGILIELLATKAFKEPAA